MILRFEMPDLDLGALSTLMHRWHKAEGDQISYGDDICEVFVEETKTITRSKHASDLLGGSARKRPAGAPGDPGTSRVANYAVRLVSSDVGYLRRISAPEGESLSAGATLALMTSDGGEDLPADVDDTWPTFRVIWDYELDDPYE